MRSLRGWPALFFMIVLLAPQASTRAQDTATVRRKTNPWIIAWSAGVPGSGHETAPYLFTVGVSFTEQVTARPAWDMSVVTMPYTLGYGAALFAPRIGGAIPVPLASGVLFLPSAGFSAVVGWSPEDAVVMPGAYAGIAMVLRDSARGSGVRAGVTWHAFPDTRRAIWLAEIGMVQAIR